MKCMVILCVVLLIFTTVSAKKSKHNNEEREKSIKKVLKECQKNEETRIEGTILKKIRKQKQVEIPENYGAHKLCILKGVGVINEDNSVNVENLKKRVNKKASEDQDVDAIVSECGASHQDPKGTAINIDKCLIKHGVEI